MTTRSRMMAAGLALLLHGAHADTPAALPSYGADPGQTSVSGLSSGAYMAVQLQVAYSATIVGAGIVAGGPYYCAADNDYFVGLCTGTYPLLTPGPGGSIGTAKGYAISHEIDALSHLKHRRLYVFSGSFDKTVDRSAVDSTVAFFQSLGVTGKQLLYVTDLPAGHGLIAIDATHACGVSESPYLNHCDLGGQPYDQASALLSQIYGTLAAASTSPAAVPIAFDQRPYGSAAAAMADVGYLYAPPACRVAGARCRVHVALHGCEQAAESVGDAFYVGGGYNRWADTNRLLILYPQVNKSALLNAYGCWDWWGYTGSNYAMKSAAQMKAIMSMVQRLTQP